MLKRFYLLRLRYKFEATRFPLRMSLFILHDLVWTTVMILKSKLFCSFWFVFLWTYEFLNKLFFFQVWGILYFLILLVLLHLIKEYHLISTFINLINDFFIAYMFWDYYEYIKGKCIFPEKSFNILLITSFYLI